MLSPIQLTPNMDMATLVNAINDMMRQIESENRTQVIKDENGINRIIIGRWPDGQYGLLISNPGVDVLELFNG
jgi:hypothetical protein